MAFGFGVGDILMLTKKIVDTIEDIHDAPKELQELVDRVESVEATLESIDELAHAQAAENMQNARNMRNLARLKQRVKDVLVKMHDVVIKYRDNQGRVKPFNRVMYGVWDKRGAEDLVVKLAERTDDLTTFLTIQTWRLTNQIRPLIDEVLTRTRQEQVEPAKDQSPLKDDNVARRPGPHKGTNVQTTVSDQVEQVQAALDRVLQTERPSDPTVLPDLEDVSVERELEIQLGQAGIGASVIKALIEIISTQRKQLAHPEDIDPISATGGKHRLEVPKGWIMVVDSYNEVWSIVAQTYLEFVRVWTVNNGGGWLFNRVESAGVQVETKFSKRSLEPQSKPLLKGGKPPKRAALKAIAGKNSFFRSEEKNDILARIAQHRSRGIDNWHFRKYEYMLCLDKSVYETLTALAKCCKKRYGDMPSYANLSKIILLKDINLKDAAINLNVDDTSRLVETIKDGIKSFLRSEYKWKRPSLPIGDGPFRAKQIVLPNNDIKLDPAEKEAKLNEISTRTDCRIRVTDEKFTSQLFSITGRKEALPFAASLLKEALL